MSRNLPLQFFPSPPTQYDSIYFAQLVNAFAVYMQNQQNPGEGRNTFSVFTNLQTNDFGLETGAIFNVDGFVKITELNTPHVVGNQATGGVGTVTVTT
jgi:hypothetical protein